jgi:hypothetical protein
MCLGGDSKPHKPTAMDEAAGSATGEGQCDPRGDLVACLLLGNVADLVVDDQFRERDDQGVVDVRGHELFHAIGSLAGLAN